MHRLTYVVFISLANYYRKKPCQPCVMLLVNSRFRSCTCLAHKPMTVVFGLGTRLHVRMCTKLENGVLCNGQQLGSAVNNFFDHGKLAMKSLSGCEAARSDEHQNQGE